MNKEPSEGGEAGSDTTKVHRQDTLGDVTGYIEWGGGTVWRHGDQLVCYESGKNWEAWGEARHLQGELERKGPI